jgi:thioredoxin-related protein
MLKVFRTWLLALMLAAFISPLAAQELPLVSDLQKDGQESQARGLPIMVFFMSNSCPYCEEVRKLYLEPMYRDGEYRNKIIMRVINIDSGDYMRDFNGRRTDHISFADSQGANFTPVIKFYDSRGNELVQEMLGYSTPDFYQAYLEGSIRGSIDKLKQRKTAAIPKAKYPS